MIPVPEPHRILCFGRDPLLLETRSMVLATRYPTVQASSLETIETFAGEVDLVLLCHTLTFSECLACNHITKRRWPKAKVVAIASGEHSCLPDDADQILYGFTDPQRLLAAVQLALSQWN